MQQFIPLEDDWDLLESLRPEDLIPYRVGMPLPHDPMTRLAEPAPLQLVSSIPCSLPG